MFGPGTNFPLVWLPYDDHKAVKNSFFSDNPLNTFKNGKFNVVPTMIGLTKDEGLLQGQAFFKDETLFERFW